jgi:four helix bundle protein
MEGPNGAALTENTETRGPRGHELEARTKRFALRVIRFVAALPSKGPEEVLNRQLLRAATSVGANHRAARRSRSRREFVAKLGVVLEEADESAYWLELLECIEGRPNPDLKALLEESRELVAIFSASLVTARSNLRK